MVGSLVNLGVEVEVATTDDDGPGKRKPLPRDRTVTDGGSTYRFFSKQTEFYKFSWPFRSWVRRHAGDYDLVHIHSLFSYTSIAAAHARDVPGSRMSSARSAC